MIERKLGLTMEDHDTEETSCEDIVKDVKLAPEKMNFINGNENELEAADRRNKEDGSETDEMKICFKNLQAFSACFDAFAHGGNDVGLVF